MRFVVTLLLLGFCARAQPGERNTLTFSGGISRPLNGYSYENATVAALGGGYSFRLMTNAELEAGVFVALNPLPALCNASGCYGGDNRFYWVPFGGSFVVPTERDRVEFSLGAGGLYQRFSISNPNTAFGQESYSAWGGYAVAGAKVALDRARHFWLGATPRFLLANGGNRGSRWFFLFTGDVGFRF